jgi:hypothetical protein
MALGDSLAAAMLKMKFNPFRPNGIVPPGAFAGRYDELQCLEKVLHQTKNGNPEHFLITGERGIGKSSLMFYMQCIADGSITTLKDDKFNFIVVSVELDDETTYAKIITKIGAELRREIAKHENLKEAAKAVWDFLSRWEVLGVKYEADSAKNTPTEQLLEELCFTIERTLENVKAEKDGILILIDEADKPNAKAHLGAFSKLLTERLVKQHCNYVALGLAGLPHVFERLKGSHESSVRVFRPLPLEVLKTADRQEVVQRGLVVAKEKNGYETPITPEALELICNLSEGYPHFIQQFAYSAFDCDKDNKIDADDVKEGAFGKHGALEALALRYFNEWYFDQIGSDEYREVLKAMSAHSDGWVTKAQLRAAVKIKESTLRNALNALKARNIIQTQKGRQGVYKLPNRSFAVWIRSLTAIQPV